MSGKKSKRLRKHMMNIFPIYIDKIKKHVELMAQKVNTTGTYQHNRINAKRQLKKTILKQIKASGIIL